MKLHIYHRHGAHAGIFTALLCLLGIPVCWAVEAGTSTSTPNLLAHDNLVAWEAAPYDTKKRTPEERAQMFVRLGIKHYAYLSSTNLWDIKDDVNVSHFDVDAEIEAMQKYHIDILAWYFWINSDHPADVPVVLQTLEAFKRHHIHPQIWVANSSEYLLDGLRKAVPKGSPVPLTEPEFNKLSSEERKKLEAAWLAAEERNYHPATREAQHRRVEREAARIKELVDLAAPYDCKVYLYNHRGWFGIEENELAIIHRLEELGVPDMRMVYNFAHSRDARHDDAKNFPELWAKIKPHVAAVNVVGLNSTDHEGTPVYPSQGDLELGMMRTIQESGWVGPVGALVLWKQDDTEVVLRNSIKGIDWLAAELKQPGSGGPRPLPVKSASEQ